MNDVTRILSVIEQGDPQAARQLLPLVYEELRNLAAQKMAQENPGQTLQPTALVHEAYLRLVDTDEAQQWNSRGHFFAAAAEAMRRILIDSAQRKEPPIHGGDWRRVNLHDELSIVNVAVDDLLALDQVLTKFTAEEPAKAELVKLRFFAGLTTPEAAEALDISIATAERWWTFARVWLYSELSDPENSQDSGRNCSET